METENINEINWEQRYVRQYIRADGFYSNLLIAVGAVAAAGIFIAVMLDVIVGACVAICAAILYSYFSSDGIYKRLGLRYTHARGSIHITRAVAKYGDTLVIPTRLVYADVTEIADGAFSSEKNAELARVYIPKSITRIGGDLFGGNTPPEILFEGTPMEWQGIVGADALSELSVTFEVPAPVIPKKPKKSKKQKNTSPSDESAVQGEADGE